MAGKFVSIEEAARLLGVSVEEIHRFVDRKKLFPMRDGSALKFKFDEIERVAASLGDDGSQHDPLALDLDLHAPGDDLKLGDAVDLDAGASGSLAAGSQTLVRGGSGGDVSGLALGDDVTSGLGGDLELDSIIGASSPSLAGPSAAPPSGSVPGSDDPLTLDLSAVDSGSAARGAGSGSGFSAPLDGGLSLEGESIAASGIDLDLGPSPGSGVSSASGSLVGDAFDLGTGAGDEDSASVVIATEESGDSSFFNAAVDDSSSVAFGDSSLTGSESSSMIDHVLLRPPMDMTFSGWQIAGLTCCSILLLTSGLIMYDLAWTIRSPQGTPVSAPLLNALSEAFGWRR